MELNRGDGGQLDMAPLAAMIYGGSSLFIQFFTPDTE
jgi:hypothetical protein